MKNGAVAERITHYIKDCKGHIYTRNELAAIAGNRHTPKSIQDTIGVLIRRGVIEKVDYEWGICGRYGFRVK